MPSVFEAYLKLFHPIYFDPTISDQAVSWHEAEAQKKSAGVIAGGTLVRDSSDGRIKGDRISWRKLAACHGLTYTAEINDASFSGHFKNGSWPRYLLGPDEGTLDHQTCEALVSVLKPTVVGEGVFFYYSGLSVRGYQPRLYTGDIGDMVPFVDQDVDLLATPEYWWPRSREWCVFTSWDLSFTLIGGSKPLAEAIARQQDLETVPVSPITRIDYRADELNFSSESLP